MSLSMELLCATMQPEEQGQHPGELKSWMDTSRSTFPVNVLWNTTESNSGVVGSYERLYRESDSDVLVYAHDDVIMREEGWDERIKQEFEADERVGVVGLGGALRHGSPELYKTPYRLQQLGRSGYLSNVDDAETHGERFTGSRDVAVLDGFVLAIRRSFLDRVGGWKVLIDGKIDFISYDYVICCLAHRFGYRIRCVGVRCHHKGGTTSTKMNVDRQAEYDYSHRWCYDNLKDVLPWKCD